MLAQITSLGLLVACLASPPAYADDTEAAVEFFHTICLKPGPDFEGTADQAKRLKWTPISAAFVPEMAPIKEVLAFRAWLAKLDDTGTEAMIGVSRAKLDGHAVHTCTIALLDADYLAFERRFFERTDAEKIGDQSDGVQVSKLYFLIAGNRKQIAKLTYPASQDGRRAIVASSIAPET